MCMAGKPGVVCFTPLKRDARVLTPTQMGLVELAFTEVPPENSELEGRGKAGAGTALLAGRHIIKEANKGGEPDSTGVRFRRMRAEDHQPRQKMENNLTADSQLALAA
jgi:hypothetical protein